MRVRVSEASAEERTVPLIEGIDIERGMATGGPPGV